MYCFPSVCMQSSFALLLYLTVVYLMGFSECLEVNWLSVSLSSSGYPAFFLLRFLWTEVFEASFTKDFVLLVNSLNFWTSGKKADHLTYQPSSDCLSDIKPTGRLAGI